MLIGNVYYARKAQRVVGSDRPRDVTALPYGINTISLFAFVFLVMLPVKLSAASVEHCARGSGRARVADRACGVFVGPGVIQVKAPPFADFIRPSTPRTALLSTFSGMAISFHGNRLRRAHIRTSHWSALLPLWVILTTYSPSWLPVRIPGSAWAVGLAVGGVADDNGRRARTPVAAAIAPALQSVAAAGHAGARRV